MSKFLVAVSLCLVTASYAYGLQSSICSEPPSYWIGLINELAADNLMDIDKKITALTDLKGSYSSCPTKKEGVLARMFHRLGAFYIQAADFEKGIELTKEAIELNSSDSEDSEKSYLSYSYFNLGTFYRNAGFNSEALNYFELAIQSGIQFPENVWLMKKACLNKASIYREIGEFQKCIETAEQGIILPKMETDLQTQGDLMIQKIQAQIELNRLDQAKKELILLAELAFSEVGQSLDIVNGYYTTNALLLDKLNLHQQAIENLQKSLAINIEFDNVNEIIRSLINIGFIYDKGLNQKDKAIDTYNQALGLANNNGRSDLNAMIYNNMGVVYWRNKSYKEALTNYQKGLRSLGFDSLANGITENPTISQLQTVSNHQMLVVLLGNKAESLLELSKTDGDTYLDASIETHKLAVKMIDHMRWNQLTQESKLYWRNISKELFENALEACTIKQDVESAYYFLEKSRAVMLSDKLSELGAKQFIPLVEKEKEHSLRTNLYNLNNSLFAIKESDPEYPNIRMNWLSITDSLNHFVKNLEKKYPVYFQYKYDTTFHTLNDFKKIGLEKDQSFLSLFVGEKNVYKFCVEQGEPTLRRMASEGFLEKIDTLMALVSSQERINQNYPAYTAVANNLYETIFGDLPLTNTRLIVSLDDVFFPFEALITDRNVPSSFLLNNHAVSYTYSADYLIKNKGNHTVAVQSFLGIAPVSYAPHLNQVPLLGADLSLKRIQNQFSLSKLLTFAEATKENFLKNINQFGIIQLYSHAEAKEQGSEPYLVFADTILNLSELQFIEKSLTQLIILSACNTGVGEFMKGEGIFSLARAFSAAGIPSGINSLWKINTKSTFQVTELFHQFISDGLPTDVALQKAKLAFIANGHGNEKLPYFWGANVLVGPAFTFKTTKYSWPWITFGVFVGACLIAGVLYLKKTAQRGKA